MEVTIGSIVRVPLGGRRVRGWVTGLRHGDRAGLKEIVGVSGAHPIFTEQLLQTLRWAAIHYVSPLAALIPKAGPPNLPVRRQIQLEPPPTNGEVPPVAGDIVARIEQGTRPPSTFLAGVGPWEAIVESLAGAAARTSRSAIIVVPTATECGALAAALRTSLGNRVVAATSAAPAAEQTAAWSQARDSAGTVVVGTPEVALWPAAALAVAVIVEEGRRAMKARQTPTVHVRELLRKRASVERIGLLSVGHVPTLETVKAGVARSTSPGRTWPLVEVIDRNLEPPTSNPIADATQIAIATAAKRKEPVFVFVSRRGYSPAARCVKCGELRRCPQCGSNPGPAAECERCGRTNGPCTNCGAGRFAPVGAAAGRVVDELRRAVHSDAALAGQETLVQVGTERDIPPASTTGLAVIIDADSMLLRPHYRAEEDTLRVLARVAATVRRGRGRRCIVQTRMPTHRVVQAMRAGHSDEVIDAWLAERESEQLPPFGELLAIELAGESADADAELRHLVGERVAVYGPGAAGDRRRWLLQAPDLRHAKVQLRELVQAWRDRGITVRVDADPMDV